MSVVPTLDRRSCGQARRRRRVLSAAMAVILAGSMVGPLPALAAPAAAAAAPLVASVAGSLQSELGCAADWDPVLRRHRSGGRRRRHVERVVHAARRAATSSRSPSTAAGTRTTVPAERWTAANIPVVLEGATAITFAFDHTSHLVVDDADRAAARAAGLRRRPGPAAACATT